MAGGSLADDRTRQIRPPLSTPRRASDHRPEKLPPTLLFFCLHATSRVNMRCLTALPSTTAGLPSLALCRRRHRRHPHPAAAPVRAWNHSRGLPLLPSHIQSQKVELSATTSGIKKASSLLLQCGALMGSFAPPVLAVTGKNNNFDEDLTSTLIQAGIVAIGYFLVMPPIIMNWMRLRWYKRKFFEMYLQFMFVFIFFPGLLLWAPFLNFRRFPRDPTMKYPWDTPKDVSTNNPGT